MKILKGAPASVQVSVIAIVCRSDLLVGSAAPELGALNAT